MNDLLVNQFKTRLDDASEKMIGTSSKSHVIAAKEIEEYLLLITVLLHHVHYNVEKGSKSDMKGKFRDFEDHLHRLNSKHTAKTKMLLKMVSLYVTGSL